MLPATHIDKEENGSPVILMDNVHAILSVANQLGSFWNSALSTGQAFRVSYI